LTGGGMSKIITDTLIGTAFILSALSLAALLDKKRKR